MAAFSEVTGSVTSPPWGRPGMPWPGLAGTRLSVQANVDHLFNARYFESVSGTYTVVPGSPRSWIGSVRVEF